VELIVPDIDLVHGIDSLTNFKRNTAAYLEKLRTSGQPLILTVNGKAELVVLDVASYQRLVAGQGEHPGVAEDDSERQPRRGGDKPPSK
jgi:prevent-host-death family protein